MFMTFDDRRRFKLKQLAVERMDQGGRRDEKLLEAARERDREMFMRELEEGDHPRLDAS